MQALLEHEGLSRVVLTSRRLPQDLAGNRMLVLPIHALSLNEAATLAREMPNLGRLLMGKGTVGLERGRVLAKRTLSLVQGHPKLIELADAQAGDPAALEKYLEGAAAAWGRSESDLDRFFQEGESARSAEEFLDVLTGWTKDVSLNLPEGSRRLFLMLCALEDADRLDWIVKQVWPELWKDLAGEAPELDQALKAVRSSGLADTQALGEGVKYVIHPGVAQAGREMSEEKFRSALDSKIASFWRAVFGQATSGEQEMGQLAVMAGLRSAPYLLRLKRWDEASVLLEQAIYRDSSPETIASVLPLLRQITLASMGTDRELIEAGVLAEALRNAGRWQEAEGMLRSLIPRCVSQGDFRSASVRAGDLFNILLSTGRFEEALKLTEEIKAYTLRAGLGPWTQYGDEVRRLQALDALGRYDEVLKDVEELRVQIRSLPQRGDKEETVEPWNVLEAILDTGCEAAMRLDKNEKALELNAERIEAKKSRGATELELARTRFNDNGPLLNLKRYDQDFELLLECKEIFEREKDIPALAQVFTALADLEDEMSNLDQAMRFSEASLRYNYLTGDAESISISHNNQAVYLSKAGSNKTLVHDMASGIIRSLIHSGLLGTTLRNFSLHLTQFGSQSLPSSFDEVCRTVEEVDGVRFRELFRRLAGADANGDQVMSAVIDLSQEAEHELGDQDK